MVRGADDSPGIYRCEDCDKPFMTDAARRGHKARTECGGSGVAEKLEEMPADDLPQGGDA